MANGWNEYVKSVFSDVAPCDNCHHFDDCKSKELACNAFNQYINSSSGRWNLQERKDPSEEMFIKIFKENENALAMG